MSRWTLAPAAALVTVVLLVALVPACARSQAVGDWAIHDTLRPPPPVVRPGEPPPMQRPPSDALVLFDGATLSHWRSAAGGAAGWKVENGYVEVVAGAGDIETRQGFGDVQLHIEWATPARVEGTGQGRGNSGVFLMGCYEVQVLESWENRTYADGQAAALYGQYPPMVNASRPPGEWQTYDIVFRRPRFEEGGALVRPARITVLHNGVLVHDAVELTGPSGHYQRPPYTAHPDRLPIRLQDHGNPVRFRNIWLRELPEP
ncbi:MAG TPA: DUF1080 domain-containing protein [Gemmatimonadaceae bacterium]|nr:DUF1080 domain-containing protein [Gemmatimonadaceae bacterium]